MEICHYTGMIFSQFIVRPNNPAMKKHIICNYKNGALLFCTTAAFKLDAANEILEVFNEQGLVSLLEPNAKNVFHIIGRIHVNYDPFVKGNDKWEDVLSRMTSTIDILEAKLKAFLDDGLTNDEFKAAS